MSRPGNIYELGLVKRNERAVDMIGVKIVIGDVPAPGVTGERPI